MQNDYIKELSKKTFQEEPALEFQSMPKRQFHVPSFFSGLLVAVIINFVF
ncbi:MULTISPECIES: hypothetical protein [Vibrio]|nr:MULTISPECIES: hypothetical protein [Vibrio]USD33504.1 hypothetical protein J8Z27_05185 [Vibrio sp. SCSIO 43186]USD46573.1 hypothetical protein J4N38_05360 [Vibrio sp. SCSIO 43145]USD70628.1 hypothetical protein J4N41_05185 [Vibrio sp. SCSIO 43139]